MADVIDMQATWYELIKDLPYNKLVGVVGKSGPLVMLYVLQHFKDENHDVYEKLLNDLKLDSDIIEKIQLQFMKMSTN